MYLFYIISIFLVNILFFIGTIGIFLNRKHLITVLMSLEIIFLAINLNYLLQTLLVGEIFGEFISVIVLTLAASESAIGLALVVVYYSINNNLSVV